MLALSIVNLLATVALAIVFVCDIEATREAANKSQNEMMEALETIKTIWDRDSRAQTMIVRRLDELLDFLRSTQTEEEAEEEEDGTV